MRRDPEMEAFLKRGLRMIPSHRHRRLLCRRAFTRCRYPKANVKLKTVHEIVTRTAANNVLQGVHVVTLRFGY